MSLVTTHGIGEDTYKSFPELSSTDESFVGQWSDFCLEPSQLSTPTTRYRSTIAPHILRGGFSSPLGITTNHSMCTADTDARHGSSPTSSKSLVASSLVDCQAALPHSRRATRSSSTQKQDRYRKDSTSTVLGRFV